VGYNIDMGDQGNNYGGFGAISPDDMANIKAALDRRGMGDQVPALMQQSGAGATPAPQLPPDIPQGAGGMTPQPGPVAPGQIQPEMEAAVVESGVPPSSPEAEIILKAMADRLKTDSRIREAQLAPQQPSQPSQPQLSELGQLPQGQ
jgi:hypothetical protein